MAVTVPGLVAEQGERYGDKVFAIFPESDASLTYRALAAGAADVVSLLLAQGVHPGDRVAILLPKGPEYLFALFGAMSMGAVALPINPQLKPPELRYIFQNAQPRAALADRQWLPGLEEAGLEDEALSIIATSSEKDWGLSADAPQSTMTAPGPEDVALLVYTSGTTGHPKGVLLSHKNLLVDAGYIVEAHQLTAGDRALCVLPLYHINGLVVTALAPLYSGGSVVIAQRFSASAFWELLARWRCSWFSVVPTIVSILLNTPADTGRLDLSHLRFGRSASAPLPVALHRSFEERFGCPLIETLGITEAASTVFSNSLPPHRRKYGSVGLPIGSIEATVIDDHGAELAPYQVGEIAVKGESVMLGYFRNAEETARTVVDGWLRTGDLGYRDEEGFFFITDRKKEVIIRGGVNISPREVDEVLYTHRAVLDAATVGVPHPIYGEEVKAFVVLKDGVSCPTEALITFCRQHLADFKCPKEVEFVLEIPKGPSGKVQRRKLLENLRP